MKYDVVVLGGGIGGYSAAIKLVHRGYKVALVEENLLGGECTNYGCVPSKALYKIAQSMKGLSKVVKTTPRIDKDKVISWIEAMVLRARNGIEYLLEKYGVKTLFGKGIIKNSHTVRVHLRNGGKVDVEGRNIVVATGTDPLALQGIDVDHEVVLTNRDIFSIEIPDSILIIGGGAIGVEMAYALSSLGVKTYLVEAMKRILPFTDADVSRTIERFLKKENSVEIYKNILVKRIQRIKGRALVELSNGSSIEVDKVLIAIGRRPRASGIGLDTNNVKTDAKGYVVVDENCRTTNPRIYATGDVTGPPLLAHKALIESTILSQYIAYGKSMVKRPEEKDIPTAIFSGLEVAYIGYTEEYLKERGVKYKRVKMPMGYMSAVAIKDGEYSFVKMLLDENNNVLGIHIVAPNASEVIAAFMPIYYKMLSLEKAQYIPYQHLSVSEVVREFAEFLLGEPVHIFLKK